MMHELMEEKLRYAFIRFLSLRRLSMELADEGDFEYKFEAEDGVVDLWIHDRKNNKVANHVFACLQDSVDEIDEFIAIIEREIRCVENKKRLLG